MNVLRPELTPLPDHMLGLPIDRGYPVPYFVEWVIDGRSAPPGDPRSRPDFRIMSQRRLNRCVKDTLCWVCGSEIKTEASFVIGPMCVVNRTSAEPPSHHDCATWSAINCPFLSRPRARRRDHSELVTGEMPGVGLERNPGVTIVWVTSGFYAFRAPNNGGRLFHIGEPVSFTCWREGRPATGEEIKESIATGLPALMALAEDEGVAAVYELRAVARRAVKLLVAA